MPQVSAVQLQFQGNSINIRCLNAEYKVVARYKDNEVGENLYMLLKYLQKDDPEPIV